MTVFSFLFPSTFCSLVVVIVICSTSLLTHCTTAFFKFSLKYVFILRHLHQTPVFLSDMNTSNSTSTSFGSDQMDIENHSPKLSGVAPKRRRIDKSSTSSEAKIQRMEDAMKKKLEKEQKEKARLKKREETLKKKSETAAAKKNKIVGARKLTKINMLNIL